VWWDVEIEGGEAVSDVVREFLDDPEKGCKHDEMKDRGDFWVCDVCREEALAALDAERQEHAKEVANLKARGDSYSNLYLEACNYLADLRQRIAELEAHPYREYQLQIARLLHTEEKEEKP
jgi:hypothetical protein